jgi:RNA polymerase sigma-70 factor (ECF subfamily)
VTEIAEVEAAIAEAHDHAWAQVLAATARVAQDLDLAEECVQEAYIAALQSWVRDGIPRNPAAWLTTTARRRAVDAVRRERALRAKLPLLVEPEAGPEQEEDDDPWAAELVGTVPDERLRLVFLCCHPALAQEAQLALTLRLVCGVSTADIAKALLVTEPTLAARITRAKKKIASARIPFRLPKAAELPDRLGGVLGVVHLLFTTGHTAPSGASLLRTDLVEQSLRLARMLRELMPDEPEVRGLLALLLLTDARRATRVDADGRLLRLEDQDRSRWDRAALTEGQALIVDASRTGRAGRYLLQAAIASLYAEAPSYQETDWHGIAACYDALSALWPSPVVALNRTVAQSMLDGPARALESVVELEHDARLAGSHYLPALKADLLLRLGRPQDAAIAYSRALELVENAAEREFLRRRLAEARQR